MEASACCLPIGQPNCYHYYSQPKIPCPPNKPPPLITLKASQARRFRHLRLPLPAVEHARPRGWVPELKEELGVGEDGEGGKGVVELMERLEKEAIMGEDEGIDPADYSRRAEIFDMSSRVFRAHKARRPPSDDQSTLTSVDSS